MFLITSDVNYLLIKKNREYSFIQKIKKNIFAIFEKISSEFLFKLINEIICLNHKKIQKIRKIKIIELLN